MKMTTNPTNKTGIKPEVKDALRALDADDKYRYSFYVSRRLMADYIHLCKKRKVKPTEEIAAFLQRELKRYDALT